MKFIINPFINVRPGTTRIKQGFLFFPRIAGNEFRWLCFAKWREVYTHPQYDSPSEWVAEEWVR